MSESKKSAVLTPKKEIAKIDRKPRKQSTDRRCKLDKEICPFPPQTKHHGTTGGIDRAALDRSRTMQQLIKFNHSILEYLKKDQEIEEAYVLLEQHDKAPFDLSTEEVLTPEVLTDDDLEATQLQPED